MKSIGIVIGIIVIINAVVGVLKIIAGKGTKENDYYENLGSETNYDNTKPVEKPNSMAEQRIQEYNKSKNDIAAIDKNKKMLARANKITSRVTKSENKDINKNKMKISNKKAVRTNQKFSQKELKKYILFHEVIERKY